jgi:hypothetical protein
MPAMHPIATKSGEMPRWQDKPERIGGIRDVAIRVRDRLSRGDRRDGGRAASGTCAPPP